MEAIIGGDFNMGNIIIVNFLFRAMVLNTHNPWFIGRILFQN